MATREESEQENSEQLFAREREARLSAELSYRRAALLAEASTIVDLSLDDDPAAAVSRIARLAVVKELADICWIDLVVEGDRLRELAIVHRDPDMEVILREISRRYPPDPSKGHPLIEAARSGETQLYAFPDEAVLLRIAQDDEHLALMRRVAPDATMIAPMVVRGRVVGLMKLGRLGRDFTEDEISFCKEFARRIAGPVENVRMYCAEREARMEAERIASALRRLQENTAELAAALTSAEVGTTVVKTAVDAFCGAAGMVAIPSVDGEWLEIIAQQGFPESVVAPLRRLPILHATPATIAYCRREPEFIETRAELRARYPHLATMTTDITGTRALLCVPLMLEGKAIGVLGVSYREDRRFLPGERASALILAGQCAQALDRARLHSVERRAAAHNRLLAEAGEVLSSSIDYETTLENVACLAMPLLADFCVFDVIEGVAVRRLVRAYADRPVEESAPELALVRETGLKSSITVKLLARTEALGTLTFCFAESGRHHTPADIALAKDLARRAAMAVENARLHRASQAATLEAERANRAKDDFLSLVSHELRAPLNAILGWSQMLRGDKGKEAATAAKGLAVIERSAHAQTRLIEDLLDVSRIVSGKLRLELRPLDLEPVVRGAAEVIRPAAFAKNIDIDIDALPSVIVSGDPDRLQQVVLNLLGNAVKFTPKGGFVEIRLESREQSATIVVHDSGMGIDPEFLPHVFERFWQAGDGTGRRHGGLGLGLAIVRHVVELHGGSVRAESSGAGRGSTFIVDLPLRTKGLPGRPHDVT